MHDAKKGAFEMVSRLHISRARNAKPRRETVLIK